MNRRDTSGSYAVKVITVHFYVITRTATVVLKLWDYNHIVNIFLSSSSSSSS